MRTEVMQLFEQCKSLAGTADRETIDNAAQKYMVNGVLYIRRGENVYDAKGNRN